MKTNVAVTSTPVLTHEGGKASHIKPLEELRRAVMTCLLFESTMYEDGDSLASRIAALVHQVPLNEVAKLAIEARSEMQLRQVPLFLVSEMSKQKNSGTIVADTLEAVIQRADELSEFLAIYWKHGARKPWNHCDKCTGYIGPCTTCPYCIRPTIPQTKHPLSAGIKRGLARAFTKFNAYSLAKYNGDGAVKLRDVMFLTHPKPTFTGKDGVLIQAANWKKLADNTLESPDTWEVALSAGKDKKETFERLILEGKLGGLAVLRNLRNMQKAGVNNDIIRERLKDGCGRCLPFRFVVAAKYAPMLEDALETAMFKGLEDMPMLPGKTALLVDLSGSMYYKLSAGYDSSPHMQYHLCATSEETSRKDVAAGLAMLLREKAQQLSVASFTTEVANVAPRRGFALRDAIIKSLPSGGTHLKSALVKLQNMPDWKDADRVIVITDEQSQDGCAPAWCKKSYIINVAPYAKGVGYDSGWCHINGWSERVIDYIQAIESEV